MRGTIAIILVLLAIIAILATILINKENQLTKEYGEGFDAGKQSQREENARYGVMKDGKWLDGFGLAR